MLRLLGVVCCLWAMASPALAEQPQAARDQVQQAQERFPSMQRRPLLVESWVSVAGPSGQVELRATRIERDGAVTRLKGHVQIKTAAAVISADQADYNSATDEINAHGYVRIKLLLGPAKR